MPKYNDVIERMDFVGPLLFKFVDSFLKFSLFFKEGQAEWLVLVTEEIVNS